MDANKMIRILSLLLAVLIVSCVKDPQDIPSGFSGDPVFGMTAIFEGGSVKIEAGKEDWTSLPLNLQKDSLQVYTSIFSMNGCLDQCSPSWTFSFYQAVPVANDPVVAFSNTIQTGSKDFVLSDLEVDSFDISLTTHPGLFMSGYSYWEDLNGPTTTFFHAFGSVVGYQENIDVCFQSLAYTGCQYTQCIHFDPTTLVPCLISIEPKLENPNYVSLSVRPQGTPPFQIEWFNESTSSTIVIPVQDSTAEIYASLNVTDALGNRSHLSQTIRVQDLAVDACYFPITLLSTPIENSSPAVVANRAEISYRDEEGVLWSSSFGVQPGDSKMLIDQISAYGLSPDNLQTYLVDLSITAQLFNEITGESRLFQSQRLSIPLTHP
ncbi:MAG: hypothetical protein SH808_08125 [Saprospiraceae bacterium]|mgnify:CR=1 FL=1|nr:hypothetical protein [Saprospiraceae bacterium]